MKKKYIELIHKDLDGTITASEKKVLREALDNDPALWQLQTDLKQATEILGKVSALDPPPYLKSKIINSLPAKRHRSHSRLPARIRWIRERLFTPPPRPVFVLISGIMVGVIFTAILLMSLSSRTGIPLNEIYGTIGLNGQTITPLDEVPVEVAGIQGYIRLNGYLDMVYLDMKLDPGQTTDLLLTYRQDMLSFISIRPVDRGILKMQRENNQLKLSGDMPFHCLVIFKKISTNHIPIDLKIFQSGSKIFDYQFSVK